MRPLASIPVIALLLTLLAAIASPAAAQTRSGKMIGQWEILDEGGAGCTITLFNKTTILGTEEVFYLLLGYQPANRKFALIIGSSSGSFALGQAYQIVLRFDGLAPVPLYMPTAKISSRIVLAAEERDFSVLFNQLATRRTLVLEQDGRSIGNAKLDGGAQAVAALLECQARHEGFAQPARPSPPPASSPPVSPPSARPRKADPFAD